MSRLGKMPNWQRTFVISGMLACSLSGCLYLFGHEFQIQRSFLGSHKVLAIHGVTAILGAIGLGSVLPFHLKAGLKSGQQLVSGFGQLILLGVLLITGALLYYGPATFREELIQTHWLLGILFFAIFLFHSYKRSMKKSH
jgi:hypothetical protein